MNKIKRFFALMLSTIFVFSVLPINAKAITNSSGTELADGTYKGEALGFKNKPITAEIHVQDGKVDKLNLDGSTQTPRFWDNTSELRQSIEVSLTSGDSFSTSDFDAVSGATYSSRGIINAVDNALNSEAIDSSNKNDDNEPSDDKNEDEKNSDNQESKDQELKDREDDSNEANNADKENQDKDSENVDKEDEESNTSEDEKVFESGDGTKENPFIIANEKQLRDFAVSFSDEIDYSGQYISLLNDIDLVEGDWIAIGNGKYEFGGDFNGNGHTISGLKVGSAAAHRIDDGSEFYGLFGCLKEEGCIHDVNVDVDIHAEAEESLIVGGICAYSRGTIDGCTVNGTIWGRSGWKSANSTDNHYGGGVVGWMIRGTIINCVNNASVYAQCEGGIAEAGGIVGLNNRGLVANCIGNGAISGSADRVDEGMTALGGIAAVHAGTMVSCVGNADITSNDYTMYVGELAGWATGIGYLYNNFYNCDVSQVIEDKNVSPIVSVGWLVGPGVSEENGPYSGGVNYMSTQFTKNELSSSALADKLNGTFGSYPADIKSFSSKASLKQWETSNSTVLPIGDVQNYTFKEVVIEQEEILPKDLTGRYYGRSDDKTVIVSLYKNEVGETVINLEDGAVSEDSENYKQAVESAKKKIELDDHTGYGLVDPSIFKSGDGTKANPFVIASEDQLREFNESINADESYEGRFIVLDNDIKLSNEWVLAGGSNPYPFRGTFDGRGHTISNIVMGSKEAPSDFRYAGLFPYLEGAVVKNLNIDAVFIYTKTNDDRKFYAGALASAADSSGREGVIDSVNISNAIINVETNSGAAYGGGLLGSDQFDVIANCKVDANVETMSKAAWNYTGILTGIAARSAIINNRVNGKLSVSANLNKAAAGGIGGFVAALTYNNAGNVEIKSERYTNDLGQIAGRNTGIAYNVKDYFNTDAVIIRSGEQIETNPIGTIVSGTTEGKGQVGEMVGLSQNRFNSEELLQFLNAAADAQEYQNVIAFLNENWGIKFEELSMIKPWKDKNNEQINTGETPVVSNNSNDEAQSNLDNSNGSVNDNLIESGSTSVTSSSIVGSNSTNSNNNIAENKITSDTNIGNTGNSGNASGESSHSGNTNGGNLNNGGSSNSDNGQGHSSTETASNEDTSDEEDAFAPIDKISDGENAEIEKEQSPKKGDEKLESDSSNNTRKIVSIILLVVAGGVGLCVFLRYKRK